MLMLLYKEKSQEDNVLSSGFDYSSTTLNNNMEMKGFEYVNLPFVHVINTS